MRVDQALASTSLRSHPSGMSFDMGSCWKKGSHMIDSGMHFDMDSRCTHRQEEVLEWAFPSGLVRAFVSVGRPPDGIHTHTKVHLPIKKNPRGVGRVISPLGLVWQLRWRISHVQTNTPPRLLQLSFSTAHLTFVIVQLFPTSWKKSYCFTSDRKHWRWRLLPYEEVLKMVTVAMITWFYNGFTLSFF